MILDAKAFDPDGRMRYLMKKRTEVDHEPIVILMKIADKVTMTINKKTKNV